MSIIRAIKHRLGLSVTPANNFTFDASADNGTMKLARESGQDIMTVDAAGEVAFPQLTQSLVANGYAKLPGGLIIQWGTAAVVPAGTVVVFPIPFPNAALSVTGTPQNAAPSATSVTVATIFASQFSCWASNTAGAGVSINVRWIAIGY